MFRKGKERIQKISLDEKGKITVLMSHMNYMFPVPYAAKAVEKCNRIFVGIPRPSDDYTRGYSGNLVYCSKVKFYQWMIRVVRLM